MKNIFLVPDKEKDYQSYMVYALTLIWSMVTGIVVATGFFYFPQLWLRWLLLLSIALFIALFNLTLNHFGRTRAASWSLTGMLWLYITIPCYSAGGIFAPGILSQMSVILTAGFLLGRRGGLAIGLLTIVADFGLAWLEATGHLPAPVVIHDPISRWISAIIPFCTVMVLQYYAINHLRSSLITLQRETIKRKAAVQELQDYKYALDTSSIVSISAVDGTFTFVNENFCTVSKYSAEELIGQSHSVLWSGEHPPEYFAGLGLAMQEGKSYRGEFCNRAKDGSLYWVDTTIVPFLNASGKVYQYMSINGDITRKKEALEQLRASEERYKSIITVSNTGAWEYNADTHQVWYSTQYFAMLGIDQPDGVWEDTAGMSWVDRLHPDDRERAVKIFDKFLSGGTTELYESIFRMQHKNGDWVWIWSRARRLLDKDGNITNITLGTHTDISERVKAEEKIKESERLIKKITSQVPGNTYMFEIEESGKPNILFVNRGTEDFNFTADLEEISRDGNKVLEVWHEDDRDLLHEKMKEAYQSGAPISFQYRIVVKDMIRWRWLQAVPEKNKEGKVIWYGATRDITALVDYITSVEQILFDISHVMRRPISSMLGITTLMSEGGLDREEMVHFARQLHPVAQEMDKFMRELNQVYEQKRQINALNIDFSLLVDKRNSLFKIEDDFGDKNTMPPA
ncbi:PAS domain-containing protein [Mucilaginibacter boryungensis]|uniref:histidine kinase n=1 Tax=Mucilaginibacter boryungensis TaxID=768480 RepID=A0ABR9XC87_9SPHI|nr:PAS domain-containing protein [Mucilaginibacter boryungensis]MBE9665012.1 PAS domain-containing protein [Mucilaginibacter boryungensis]